ncbi:OmpA family protein [Olivibacter sp. LS-1]|uniref:OmpA family protein n=1 Tax=Olivibacter sp. LS-1 TaxID=2592345 RepID=UPI0011EB7AF2|nr:OmpA family protein [Olivibacter sp. LS-1]QEL01917.1 OmpA family protein [Olivibacter sp. LS-1]
MLRYLHCMRLFFLFCLFYNSLSFFCSKLGAQQLNPSTSKSKKLFEEAARFLSRNDFTNATIRLEQLLNDDSLFITARQQLADIYLRQKEFEQAAKHYEMVSKLASDLTPSTWFGLGESLLNLGAYAASKQALTTYLSKVSTQTNQRKAIAQKYLADCNFSLSERKNTQLLNIHNMGASINSADDEYFPMLTADRSSIIFTRQKKGGLEYIYVSQYQDSAWKQALPIPGKVNTESYSEGAHCISPDGRYLFFTGCNKPDGKGSCDIYISHWEGSAWGIPHNLGSPINTGSWKAQPAISPDGNTLYFVSNRKGGFGGNDIWYSTLQQDGSWGVPQNMGDKVNTSFDESTPFIHADNETLYFASNGWPGFGNKDLFISKLDHEGNRLSPVNMGTPINDHLEQRALTVSLDGSTAYFAAERPGGKGGLDIYTCLLTEHLRPTAVAYVKGRVFDKTTGNAVKAAVKLTDLKNKKRTFYSEVDYLDGTFLVPLPVGSEYALHVLHPEYLFYSQHFALADTLTEKDIYAVKVGLERISSGRSAILNNIFFPTNGYELLPTSESDLMELFQLLQHNKHIRIEITGHTDNTGSAQANQVLSEKRALAVYAYLLSKGIDKTRLAYKGYGQNNPIADNTTEKGKQQNRRTEFKIIATDYGK